MRFTTPLPQPLQKECTKAAETFKKFVTSGGDGLDEVIPRSVLQQAKGFAIFTVVKAGLLLSARAGSGLAIARLPNGTFSAPSAIGTAGMGIGAQWGAELTEFLIVLNSTSAAESFMRGGKLTIGGNLSIAVGPLGRNGEAWKSLHEGHIVSMYSYSRTKGLFSGISLESSVIATRADANAIAYQRDVTAKELLSGDITPPQWADLLIQTLTQTIGNLAPDDDALSDASERVSMSGTSNEPPSRNINGAADRWPEGDFDQSQKKTMPSGSGAENVAEGGGSFDRSSIDSDSPRGGPSSQPDQASTGPARQEVGGSTPGLDENQSKQSPSRAKEEILDSTRPSRNPNDRPVPLRPALPLRPSSRPSNSKPVLPPRHPSIRSPYQLTPAAARGCVSNAPRPSEPPIPKAQTIPEAAQDTTIPVAAYSMARIYRPLSTDGSGLTPLQPQTIPEPEAPPPTTPYASCSLVEQHDEHSLSADHPNLAPSAQSPLAGKAEHNQAQGSPRPADQWDGESDLSESESVASSPGRAHKFPVKRLSDSRTPPEMMKVVALFDFFAEEDVDLSFRAGDEIDVIERTESTNDWWIGVLAGQASRRGIFPANYVELAV